MNLQSLGSRVGTIRSKLTLALALVMGGAYTLEYVQGTDRILTIGGGYAPEGNQASLEANVLFFQRLLATKHTRTPYSHRIQFADGFDPGADLQIVVKRPNDSSDAISLLEEIFAPPSPLGVKPGSQQLAYRNHRVPSISGSNRLNDVRTAMDVLKGQLRSGDRLLLYVTAHGGSAKKGGDDHETSISCWGNQDLNMSEVAKWLDELPPGVSVVLVMAQCYCGGFAHTLFQDGLPEAGLSANVRTGFFAQRHDLPAAGCRPDVDDDEEYSSYFWGALLGETRSGKKVVDADVDHDGQVSLGEAHAYAVVASETIDIPLRGSDALLRQASRIPRYDLQEASSRSLESLNQGDEDDDKELIAMTGPLQAFCDHASPINRSMVMGLCARLELDLHDEVSVVFDEYAEASREYRAARRTGFGRRSRGGYNRRRELRDAIVEQWPELADQANWSKLDMLRGEAGKKFAQELMQMPGYVAYVAGRDDRLKARDASFEAEMRQVRLRRLIHTLETIALAKNLPQVGESAEIRRYQELVKLESAVFE